MGLSNRLVLSVASLLIAGLHLWFGVGTAASQEHEIVPREALVLESLSDQPRTRREIPHDAMEAMLVTEGWSPALRPRAGAEVATHSGKTRQWQAVELTDGRIRHSALRGGFLHTVVPTDVARVMILDAAGHSMVHVNGDIHTGDVYSHGYLHLPILLRDGENDLLFRVLRGELRVRLYEPPADIFLLNADITAPDLVVGEATDTVAGVVLINATTEPVEEVSIRVTGEGLTEVTSDWISLPPLTSRKVAVPLVGPAPTRTGNVTVKLEVMRDDASPPVHTMELELRRLTPAHSHKRTFISEIDGSVQYYGLRQALSTIEDHPAAERTTELPGIVLSCHGASVEAISQSDAYASKSWTHIVAPTNRRPFGFDWEDFGRADAMEVLGIAKATLPYDPSRVWLTGHSMGGHGTWHLGVTYPDTFAAIGPSAGWIAYWTYAGAADPTQPDAAGDQDTPTLSEMLDRVLNTSDTIRLARNLTPVGVYILHGDADDNVPVTQARQMAELLGTFHRDWRMHEQPGAGHWWGSEYNDGGTACLDWPFMFDMFARRRLPADDAVRHVQFTTANPAVSSRCNWLTIHGQQRMLAMSSADIEHWPNSRRFRGTTDNIAILRLDVGHLVPGPIQVELDGQTIADITFPEEGALWLARKGGEWGVGSQPPAAHKGPHRYGAIKDALRQRFLFVYGTQGSAEENRWAFAKARYDAQTFYYRGNGAVEMIADTRFDPDAFPDRTVVLFGNATTNSAWDALLADSPVRVEPGRVVVGERVIAGDDLAAFFVRPRPDSDVASVIAVAGTGEVGMRLTDRHSFYFPFIRYPDLAVLRAEGLASGDTHHECAGYFGLDWSIEQGEFHWRE